MLSGLFHSRIQKAAFPNVLKQTCLNKHFNRGAGWGQMQANVAAKSCWLKGARRVWDHPASLPTSRKGANPPIFGLMGN